MKPDLVLFGIYMETSPDTTLYPLVYLNGTHIVLYGKGKCHLSPRDIGLDPNDKLMVPKEFLSYD